MANHAINQNFHSQLRSLVDILAITAVKEISKLVDDGFAILHLRISRSQKENEELKCQMQTMGLQMARGCEQESGLREQLLKCRCGAIQSEENSFKTTNAIFPERMDMPMVDAERPCRHGNAPSQPADVRTEDANREEENTELVLVKEETVEEDGDPQGEMNSREESKLRQEELEGALEWKTGRTEKRPVEETQNKAVNHTEELTEQHRNRRAVWEVSGLESALKTEPERAETLQHTGSEQSAGRLHTSCPEYLVCERTSQLRTLCTQGAGETEADIPSCSYATESSSESLSIHSGLQSLPHTGKGAASSLSLGSLDLKPEAVMIDSAPTEEEAEMHSAWTHEAISERNISQHRPYGEERPFVCQHCGKMFFYFSEYTRHCRVHTGEKPFSCLQCGKQFTHSSNLKVHQSVHTGERRFRCTLCGKRFISSSHLKRHGSVHTHDRPFCCGQCGHRFTTSAHLRRHRLQLHVPDGMAGVQNGVEGVRNGVAGVQNGMAGVRNGVAGYQNGMAGVRNGMAGYQSGVAGYQNGVAESRWEQGGNEML